MEGRAQGLVEIFSFGAWEGCVSVVVFWARNDALFPCPAGLFGASAPLSRCSFATVGELFPPAELFPSATNAHARASHRICPRPPSLPRRLRCFPYRKGPPTQAFEGEKFVAEREIFGNSNLKTE